MPFTFSHPAIVIWLSKTRLKVSLTALVAGSVVPDFEFLFRLKQTNNYAHHWPGVITFNVPVSILLCFLFHGVIKKTLVLLLPKWFQVRFNEMLSINWNKYAAENKSIIFISLIIGIFSHLFWDAFTHDDGFFVLLFTVLSKNIFFAGRDIPVYNFLQLICSILGLWIIYKEIKSMKKQTELPITLKKSNNYRILFVLIGCIILIFRLFLFPQYQSNADVLIATIGSFIYALIITSFVNNQNIGKIV